MSQTHRKSITKEQWDEAAASYELGSSNGAQIARKLGVSPATVSREFKRRGCVKASRIAEFVAELEAKLDAQAEEKARRQQAEATARAAVLDALVGELMDAIEEANQAGNLTMANPDIARIDRALQLALR
jgi:DNA-binding MurR/RpiR family transcriptional regulator